MRFVKVLLWQIIVTCGTVLTYFFGNLNFTMGIWKKLDIIQNLETSENIKFKRLRFKCSRIPESQNTWNLEVCRALKSRNFWITGLLILDSRFQNCSLSPWNLKDSESLEPQSTSEYISSCSVRFNPDGTPRGVLKNGHEGGQPQYYRD